MGKLTEILKEHFVDVVGGVSGGSPLYAFLETKVAGFPHNASINSKLTGIGFSIFGLGTLFSKGRDYSKEYFEVTKDSNLRRKFTHDAIYGAAFSLVSSPLTYLFASLYSNITWENISWGTGTNMLFALPGGIACGLSVDVYRDLMGTKEYEKLPELVRNQNPIIKKGLAALLTVTSAAATVAYYQLIR